MSTLWFVGIYFPNDTYQWYGLEGVKINIYNCHKKRQMLKHKVPLNTDKYFFTWK